MRFSPQRCCQVSDSTVFLKLRWKHGVFLKLQWIQSHVFWTASRGSSRDVGESRLKLRWKSHQSGTPQPSLDLDANRLVLLDRAENGDNGHSDDADIPF